MRRLPQFLDGLSKIIFPFKYFEIIICQNIILRKHCDQKSDHRTGYNMCIIYTYFVMLNGEEYKVSVVMTTCYTVGSAYDNAENVVDDN